MTEQALFSPQSLVLVEGWEGVQGRSVRVGGLNPGVGVPGGGELGLGLKPGIVIERLTESRREQKEDLGDLNFFFFRPSTPFTLSHPRAYPFVKDPVFFFCKVTLVGGRSTIGRAARGNGGGRKERGVGSEP